MRSCRSGLILAVAAGLIAGCGSTPRHTNTLIFGTNTKVAFDVGPDPTGVVSVTLGYKRQEAVWMPLLANKGKFTDSESQSADCGPANSTDCHFRGDDKRDAYSVLASFGADFSGEGQGTNVKGAAGIAQYFATGLAARLLAQKGGADLVSVQPGGSTERKAVELLSEEAKAVEKILGYVNQDGNVDGTKLGTVVLGSGLDATWVSTYGGKPITALRDELTKGTSRTMTVDLAKKIKEN